MSQSLIVALIVVFAIIVIAIVAVLARTAGKPRLRSLPDESRDRYARMWQAIETRFIDDPRGAVQEADKVAVMVLSERGANVAEDKHLPQDLVNARESVRTPQGGQDTEALRRALVHYKRIVDDAVGSERLSRESYTREMAS